MKSETEVTRGSRARFWMDNNQLHIFDVETGKSLGRDEQAPVAPEASPVVER